MKLSELILSNDPNRNNFLKRCLPVEEWQQSWDSYSETLAILDKAETSEQFIALILDSDIMRGTQIYAELSKDRPDHWKRVYRDLDSWYSTTSDAGGLRIGSDAMSIIIPNGYGDGDMRFTVVGKNCFNHDMLNFWTSVSGNAINVYDHDCGGDVVITLEGRYGVFYGYGFVVFEKWDDAK